jgi:hypothetical protein
MEDVTDSHDQIKFAQMCQPNKLSPTRITPYQPKYIDEKMLDP